jgi:hypothetical protein
MLFQNNNKTFQFAMEYSATHYLRLRLKMGLVLPELTGIGARNENQNAGFASAGNCYNIITVIMLAEL